MRSLLAIFLGLTLVACAHASQRSISPAVIAHRGASGYLPEHSLPAVAAAHVMNVDYIEQDVVLSKDGVPMVLHGIEIEVVTDVESKFPARKRKDGRYYAIDFTLAELKTLELHEFAKENGEAVFPDRFPVQNTGMKIPTLEEEIRVIQGMNKSRSKNIGIYVELKRPKFHETEGQPMIKPVINVLKRYGYSKSNDKAFLQCFDARTTKQLKRHTDLRVVQLVGMNSWGESDTDYQKMMTIEGLKEVAKYADGIGPWIGHFTGSANGANRSLIPEAKKIGLEIHVYTFRSDKVPDSFDSFEALVRFFERLGITGFFADQPDRVIQLLRNDLRP